VSRGLVFSETRRARGHKKRTGAVRAGLEFGKPLRVDLFNDIGSILELGSATNNLF
jgi:hypothetical protein